MEFYEKLNALQCTSILDYFNRNWYNIRDQWAAYATNKNFNFMNKTTNRLETTNQKLKSVVTLYAPLHTFFKQTLECLFSLNIEKDQRTINSLQRQPISNVTETEIERKYRSVLFHLRILSSKLK